MPGNLRIINLALVLQVKDSISLSTLNDPDYSTGYDYKVDVGLSYTSSVGLAFKFGFEGIKVAGHSGLT